MDAIRCSPYPHYAWLAHWLTIAPPHIFNVYECRHVTHRLLVTTHGAADVVWVTRGTETPFHAAAGDIGFFPGDDEAHTMSMTSGTGYQAYAVCVPDEQLLRVSTSEGMKPAVNFLAIPVFRDNLMEASLLRLSTSTKMLISGPDTFLMDEYSCWVSIQNLSESTKSPSGTNGCFMNPIKMGGFSNG